MLKTATTTARPTRASVLYDVNAALATFFEERIRRSAHIAGSYERLWQDVARLNQAGGKRLRPYMAVLGYHAFGGSRHDQIISVAAAWELLHLSMLIHDDIIDNDLIRYGVKNIAGSYMDIYDNEPSLERRQHLAASAALLAGDLALSSAYEIVLDSSELTSEQKLVAQRYLADAIFAVAGGELLDTESTLQTFVTAEPLTVAAYKTALYSFVGPMSAGAAIAGASVADLDDIRQFGVALGCAFQLVDDMLGIYGDPALTGKSNSGDLREGKRTYILQQAYAMATSSDRQVLDELIGMPDLNDNECQTLRAVIERSGAKRVCQQQIDEYIRTATDIIDGMNVTSEYKADLHELLLVATKRRF